MTCRKNYWGTCFHQLTTSHMHKKTRKKYLRQTRNNLFSRRNGNRQTRKWRDNRTNHVVIFAVRVSRKRDAKSPWPHNYLMHLAKDQNVPLYVNCSLPSSSALREGTGKPVRQFKNYKKTHLERVGFMSPS